jgi:hypothetical protein
MAHVVKWRGVEKFLCTKHEGLEEQVQEISRRIAADKNERKSELRLGLSRLHPPKA